MKKKNILNRVVNIYIVETLRIDDLRIDDQSSMLGSSIYTVTSLVVVGSHW